MSEVEAHFHLTSGEEEVTMPDAPNSEGDATQETGLRRSNHQRRTTTKEEDWTEINALTAQIYAESLFKHPNTLCLAGTALDAIKNDPGTPSLIETLSGENEPHFREAMTKEIEALRARKTWLLMLRSELPRSIRVIPTPWDMKIQGILMESSDHSKIGFVSEGTSRRSLSGQDLLSRYEGISCPHFYSTQDERFFKNHVLKLNMSLYGQADTPKMWYDKLKAGLEERGFT
eukprot:6058055-Ditylum_brightwellii.AAC.1